MTQSTQIAIQETTRASVNQSQQLLAIDPERYVALVFASVAEKLAQYKREANAVTFDVTTPAGMKTAIEWRAKFRDEIRLATESARKERKAPILEIGRLLDGRAKELTLESAPYEARFDEAIKAWDAARAAEKSAREEAERVRKDAHLRRIVRIKALPDAYGEGVAPAKIAEVVQQLESGLMHDYEEFAAEAETCRQVALVALRQAHVEALERIERAQAEESARAALAAQQAAERAATEERQRQEREAEEARLQREREEVARLRAEEDTRQAAERARLAEEDRRARATREAEAAQERERIRLERQEEERRAATERARTAEEAEAQRQRQAIIDAENARIQAEQEAAAILNQSRLGEIQGIQQQVMIATLGRSGVRKGGTRECIVETLEETRAWPVTEEHFGPVFFGSAQNAKRNAVAQIEQTLTEWDADEAAQARLETERADLARQQAEQAERQAEIERREREAAEAEETRQAAAKAEEERKATEVAYQRRLEAERKLVREQVASLTAEAIARWIASEIGCAAHEIAARIADIPHAEWVAIAVGETVEEAA